MKISSFSEFIKNILNKFKKKDTNRNSNFESKLGNSAHMKMGGSLTEGVKFDLLKKESSFEDKTKNFSGFDDFDPSNLK